MKRVKLIASALLALAVLAVLAGRVTAQQTNTLERTIMTFSSAVEMPGVKLESGTYVFKLADTASRNVVQVWDQDEKNMIGHWLFVQSERPRVTEDTVVMFKETQEGATPAVQYWYFPGEKVGKEFIYPKDQAERIAARTGTKVRTEDGFVEGPGIAAAQSSSAEVSVAPAPEPEPAAVAEAPAPEPAPAPAAVAEAPARAPEPAPVVEESRIAAQAPAPAPEPAPRPVGTSGQVASDELPRTASPLALSGLLGLLSLAGAAGIRLFRN